MDVPVRVFMQVGDNEPKLAGEGLITDQETSDQQVAEFLRAIANEFENPTSEAD